MTTDIIDRFHRLFRGRVDVKGTWTGGAVKEPITRLDYERHLTSNNPDHWMGIYPLASDRCTWGCIDIDGKDFPMWEAGDDYPKVEGHDWDTMLELAENLRTVLAVKDVHAWLERTRNGIHVWVFPTETSVPAKWMRRTLMAACAALDYKPKEINPKQESLAHGQVGNYVRLPYYGALAPDNEGLYQKDRYFFQSKLGEPYSISQFLNCVTTTDNEPLEACSQLWSPPVVRHAVDPTVGLDAEEMVRGLGGLGYTIWRDGPLPGNDRSSTLAHLAHLCAEDALTQQQAFAVIQSADLRWGKFSTRADGIEQMQAIVERAYAT